MAASKVSLKINNNTIIKPPRRCSAAIQTTHVVNRFGDRQVFFGEYLKTSKILGTPAEDWESGFKCIHIIFYRFQVEHSWRLSPPCNEYIHVENNVVFFFFVLSKTITTATSDHVAQGCCIVCSPGHLIYFCMCNFHFPSLTMK